MERINPSLSPLQRKALEELGIAQAMASQILASACWFAHTTLPPGQVLPYRGQAHRMLAAALDQVELMMTACEGRA